MISSVLLSPHNDDESLFASYTILRVQPHIVVVLDAHRGPTSAETRRRETGEATSVLGCTWEQWKHPDLAPNWKKVSADIAELADRWDHCYAPMPRFDVNGSVLARPSHLAGTQQHDMIGHLAADAFQGRITFYTTYTFQGRDRDGIRVRAGRHGVSTKRAALRCYRSQIADPRTAPHFELMLERGDMAEYEVHP